MSPEIWVKRDLNKFLRENPDGVWIFNVYIVINNAQKWNVCLVKKVLCHLQIYIDDVFSLKNTKFAEYLEFIYPSELELKESMETAASPHTWIVISTLTMES